MFNREIKKYLRVGKYTKNLPDKFFDKVRLIRKFPKDADLVKAVINNFWREFDDRKNYVITTRNFRLSRFVPVAKIIKMRLRTCGSVASVVAAVLRKIGLLTKLVDGSITKNHQRFRHAWLEVYLRERKRFVPYDPTKRNYKIGPNYRKRGYYLDWGELEKDYKH